MRPLARLAPMRYSPSNAVGDRFMATLAILAFFVAMFLLNFVEFGRVD